MKKDNPSSQEINPRVLTAEYAVRGAVPIKAGEIEADLKQNPGKYPFSEMTFCNIGNPQAFGQKPISFNREVLACTMNPALLDSKEVHEDVKKRAKWYLDNIISIGSYAPSMGIPLVRESVARYIEKKDNVPKPTINEICLTDGAGQAAQLFLSMLICNEKDGVMIPIPQYPLYSASLSILGGCSIPYYLDEESGWQLKPE